MSDRRIAALMAKLMHLIGYDRFLVQGGDWGASIATWLGLDEPKCLHGIYLNYIPESLMPYLGAGSVPLSDVELQARADCDRWYRENGAYSALQSTTPQTIAYALNDSPAGLAAWIIEKFRNWSDCGGNVERVFSRDDLLTSVSIYWFTRTINSSMRIYRESRAAQMHLAKDDFINVPTGIVRFAKEAPFFPRAWVERCFNVRDWREVPRGGHFPALEMPVELVSCIRQFARLLR
jgi:pimeloyl-ACP methyl ester carboxylesterase